MDIICYSNYLSERDVLIYRYFFESLNIKEFINYGTFVEMANKVLNKKCNIREKSKYIFLN